MSEDTWRAGLRTLILLRLTAHVAGEGTSREISAELGTRFQADTISGRLNELERLGSIRRAGLRLGAGRGRPQVIWKLTEQGRDEAARYK